MLTTNRFCLVSISSGLTATNGPFALSKAKAIFRAVAGPVAASKGSKPVVLLLTDGQLGNSFDAFRQVAERKLREKFGNPAEVEDLDENEQLNLPGQWRERIPYLPPAAVRRQQTEAATVAQASPGVRPPENYVDDAGGARRGYAGLSQETTMNSKVIGYQDGSYLGTDGLLHNLDGSLLQPAARPQAGTVEFASADSGLVQQVATTEAELDKVTARINRDAVIAKRQSETMPAEKRAHLLGLSALGRRVLKTEASDKRYARARKAMQDDIERGKGLTAESGKEIRDGRERSRAIYDPCPGPDYKNETGRGF